MPRFSVRSIDLFAGTLGTMITIESPVESTRTNLAEDIGDSIEIDGVIYTGPFRIETFAIERVRKGSHISILVERKDTK